MKTKKTKKKATGRRPANVWNAVRKLEGYLRKADIQAGVFMESLQGLRAAITFDVRREIVQRLCNSVNGDLLHALAAHRKRVEQGCDDGNIECNAILLGMLDTLEGSLYINPYKTSGERIMVTRASIREYDFDEHPGALDDNSTKTVEVEVLRCGWKVDEKVVVKPRVCPLGADSRPAAVAIH